MSTPTTLSTQVKGDTLEYEVFILLLFQIIIFVIIKKNDNIEILFIVLYIII
ncbi:hypothetical protein RIR_e11607_A0A2I1E3D0_9GLOM [Rhizophagus irregularis DAOM 181602=DAOM 197198]|nr:hypothetical protein RhiirB3_47900 [Rhizophagus irregularis]GET53527.1 hypothetical protein RIR_e11607_A0A2I1E3D0_9GLOM [Rhizophagus irregularis DAOM 181602=DAOM 197198]